MMKVEKKVEGMLQLAVQSVEWTYSLYWRFSTQQRMLVWGDGFYNGPIKTTKTQHPAAAEQQLQLQPPSLSRTHQLRDLYHSLSSTADDHRPLPRPSAALSPEDLTDSEWFYLLCLSFSFPPGLGLPGNAFANNKHVWITGANEIDTKIFSRAILAKSARIKTVVCIPVMDGVVELGTTEKVNEEIGFIQHIKSIFAGETQWGAAAVSELSTSNSGTSLLEHYNNNNNHSRKELELENDDDEMDSDSSSSCNRQLDEDLSLGQTNFDNLLDPHPQYSLCNNNNNNNNVHQPVEVEDSQYYSNTLSALGLLKQKQYWPRDSYNYSSSINMITCSNHSAFSNWTPLPPSDPKDQLITTTSQCLLKNILHKLPFLIHHYNNSQAHNPSNSEKLKNDKFIILRSLVPFATKMDKASILGDTLEYLKQLRQKIQDLEAQNREFQFQLQNGNGNGPWPSPVPMITSVLQIHTNLQVSIIGSDGLLEVQCPYKEGLLLHILLILQGLRIETTAVTSSINNNGIFIAHLRAKVKDNMDGKKATILEVKRAIQQILPCIHTHTT